MNIKTIAVAVAMAVFMLTAGAIVITDGTDAVSVSSAEDITQQIVAEDVVSIELSNDITLSDSIVIPMGKDVTIDLAGKDITIPRDSAIKVYGTLTINDTEGDGLVSTGGGVTVMGYAGSVINFNGGSYTSYGLYTAEGSSQSFSRALETQGTVTITKGIFYVESSSGGGTNFTNAISVNSDTSQSGTQASLTINPVDDDDVVIRSTNDYALSVRYGGSAIIQGGTFQGSELYQDFYILEWPDGGTITVTGGQFSKEVQPELIPTGYVCVPAAEGYTVVPTTSVLEHEVSTIEQLEDALSGSAETQDVIYIVSDIVVDEGVFLTISQGDILIISNDLSLTVNGVITVEGTIRNEGVLEVGESGYIENPLNVTGEGSISDYPVADDDGVAHIYTLMQLQWLARMCAYGELPSSVVLENDLDLEGLDYTPIGTYSTRAIGMDFDGNGYIISNITADANGGDAGLFGDVDGCTIHDLTLTGFDLKTTSGAIGFVAGGAAGNSTFINITVMDSTMSSASYYPGGIVGTVDDSAEATVQFIGCTVSGCTVFGEANAGAILGTSSGFPGTIGIYNCTISDTTVSVTLPTSNSVSSIGIVSGYCNTADVEMIGVTTSNVKLLFKNQEVQNPQLVFTTYNYSGVLDDDYVGDVAVQDANGNWIAKSTSTTVTFELYHSDVQLTFAVGDTISSFPVSDREGFNITGWMNGAKEWTDADTVTENLVLKPVWSVITPEVTFIQDTSGSALVLTAEVMQYEGADITIIWDDKTSGSQRTLTSPGTVTVYVTVTPQDGIDSMTVQAKFVYDSGHYVRFVGEDGNELASYYVPNGGRLSASQYPTVEERVGYEPTWGNGGGDITNVTTDLSIQLSWNLTDPVVHVSVSGTLYEGDSITVTVTFDHPLADSLSVVYTYGTVDGSVPLDSNNSGVFTVSNADDYIFLVEIFDSGNGYASAWEELTIVVEQSPTEPDFPYMPGDDDDYVPPIYVPSGSSSSDDDTVKIVACAAAAVVAAIMAAFLILGHRRE